MRQTFPTYTEAPDGAPDARVPERGGSVVLRVGLGRRGGGGARGPRWRAGPGRGRPRVPLPLSGAPGGGRGGGRGCTRGARAPAPARLRRRGSGRACPRGGGGSCGGRLGGGAARR